VGELVGVFVGVLVGVLVGELVGVRVGVTVGVFVFVLVGVIVGVLVGVFVGVNVLVMQPDTERVTELEVTGFCPLALIMESLTMVVPVAGQLTTPHQDTAPEAP
jgi:hypothetical protein